MTEEQLTRTLDAIAPFFDHGDNPPLVTCLGRWGVIAFAVGQAIELGLVSKPEAAEFVLHVEMLAEESIDAAEQWILSLCGILDFDSPSEDEQS